MLIRQVTSLLLGCSALRKTTLLKSYFLYHTDMAPEIIKRKEYLGKPVDLWSMGVLLYALLVGRFPFSAKMYPELYKKILKGHFSIPEDLSTEARDLIMKMLVVDSGKRYRLSDVKVRRPVL